MQSKKKLSTSFIKRSFILLALVLLTNSVFADNIDDIITRLKSAYDYNLENDQYREAFNMIDSLDYYRTTYSADIDVQSLRDGLINTLNDAPTYEQALIQDRTYYPFKDWSGKYGFIDNEGNTLIEPIYEWVEEFSNGLSLVTLDSEDVFINHAGEVVISSEINPEIKQIHGSFNSGRARCQIYSKENNWSGQGFIDMEGNVVIPPIKGCSNVSDFREGFAALGSSDEYGFIDTDGNWFFDQGSFSRVKDFQDGMAAVQYERNGNWGYVTSEGQKLRPVFQGRNTSTIGDFSEGLAMGYHIEKGYCFIDKSGKVAIELPFEKNYNGVQFVSDDTEFHEGLAGIIIGKNDPIPHFINKNGEIVFKIGFYDNHNGGVYRHNGLSSFNNGVAFILRRFQGLCLVDQTGDYVMQANANIKKRMTSFVGGASIVTNKNKDWEILYSNGEMKEPN